MSPVPMFLDTVKSRPAIGSTVVDCSYHHSSSVVAVAVDGDSIDGGDQTGPQPLTRQQRLPHPILGKDRLDLYQ